MINIILLLLIISSSAFAGNISYDTTYATNSSVTSANLNGNFNNVKTVVNGALDNTNANTTTGFRFYETLGSLPVTSLSQGRTVFLTSDNSWNVYTGSAWVKLGGELFYDYGTSNSASTSRSPSTILIAYGKTSNVPANGHNTISNLPFTSSASYRCNATYNTGGVTLTDSATVQNLSGSSLSIGNSDDATSYDISWYCVGT